MSARIFSARLPDGWAVTGQRAVSGDAIAWVAGLTLLALQATLALTHVPWEDETQAWNIAAWSASWSSLLANLHYEGHPALWYALLRAASSASVSPLAMAAVQAVVATVSLAILLTRAPFPVWHRLALGASYLLLFEYGTIARSYGLGVLLLLTFLTLRHRPVAWLLLAAMANIAFHWLLLSAACVAAMWLVEGRRSWPGWGLWVLGCAIMAATVWPAPDVMAAQALDPDLLARMTEFIRRLGALVVPGDPTAMPMKWPLDITSPLTGLPGGVAIALLWIVLRRDQVLLALGMSLLAVCAAFSVFVYPTGLRHCGILFLFVMAADWIKAERDGLPPTHASRGWAILAAAFGLLMAAGALKTPFVAGRAVADWARKSGYDQAVWASYPLWSSSMLATEMGKPIYDLRLGCMSRFIRWTANARVLHDADELADRALAAASAAGGAIMLATIRLAQPAPREGIAKMAAFDSEVMGRGLVVYRVTAPATATASPPPCPWSE